MSPSSYSHICLCYVQLLLRKDGAPEFQCCSCRPGGVVTCSQPFKNGRSPFLFLSHAPFTVAFAVARAPPSLCGKGRLWLIDVCRCGCWHNINHVQPSGRWFTSWTPQDESGCRVFILCWVVDVSLGSVLPEGQMGVSLLVSSEKECVVTINTSNSCA